MRKKKSIIEKMFIHHLKYERAMINIASYFNKNSTPSKELPEHNYQWDIQKNK